ncbi:TetR/AcrR family transcriptional regulator [Nocardia nova]|uniref:TetR/AcrR family transcriptional regulator n=1 Tax=Nocardia nova TaxID=37330 RepID=UPI0037B57184
MEDRADSHESAGVRTRRKPAEVRELLVTAAEAAVIRKGSAATAQEIAREAGVQRSVLYRHFSGVDELVHAAALRPFNDFHAMFRSMARDSLGDPRPLWELLHSFIEELLDNFTRHREFLSTVLSEPSPLDFESRRKLVAELNSVINEIVMLNEAEGASRGVDVSAMSGKTRLVLAMVAGIVTYGDWLLPRGEDELDKEQLVDLIADLVLYGVRAPVLAEARRVGDGLTPNEHLKAPLSGEGVKKTGADRA